MVLLVEPLKEAAQMDDLSLWVMEKVNPTKKGNRSYHYWMAMKATSLAIKI